MNDRSYLYGASHLALYKCKIALSIYGATYIAYPNVIITRYTFTSRCHRVPFWRREITSINGIVQSGYSRRKRISNSVTVMEVTLMILHYATHFPLFNKYLYIFKYRLSKLYPVTASTPQSEQPVTFPSLKGSGSKVQREERRVRSCSKSSWAQWLHQSYPLVSAQNGLTEHPVKRIKP